ncbi:LRR receptor-like serine threonine-protein kinase [Seminavis robusta]|uniref:LRR receptor-like serine threonine-protein kinase n=1 Tax=Seminavis robusta TaxID=568900 RepID=A0A9N8DRH6_9STRA|nr:LRR receptor-like serine threonine-protein kinase [Seminavis robusta]|eukprot:Sro202_g085390.1 LRR receptor-like serine threonine-protein kinase (818) ;mRNA; r:40410-42863
MNTQPTQQTDGTDDEEAALKDIRESALADVGFDDSRASIEAKQAGADMDTTEALLNEVGVSNIQSKLGCEDDSANLVSEIEKMATGSSKYEAGSIGQAKNVLETSEAAPNKNPNSVAVANTALASGKASAIDNLGREPMNGNVEPLEVGESFLAKRGLSSNTPADDFSSEIMPLPSGESLQHVMLQSTLTDPGAHAMPGMYHPRDNHVQRDNQTDTAEASLVPTRTDHNHHGGTEGPLIVANMVMDTSAGELHRAEEVTQEELQRKKRQSSMALSIAGFLAAGFLAIAVLVLVLLLALRQDSDDGAFAGDMAHQIPQNETLPPRPMTAEERMLSLLPDFTISKLNDIDSPQNRSFEWIIQDPLFDNYTDHRILQRYGFATFYYATGGGTKSYWYSDDHWLSYDHHECDWYVKNINHYHDYVISENWSKPVGPCDYNVNEPFVSATPQQMEEGGIYQHLWLYNHELGGYIPEELSLVSTLKSILLLKNQIKGSIPSHLGMLSDLEALFLYSNDLSGTLPTELGMLPNITYIWSMANPGLTGSLPSEIAQLTTLKQFLTDSCNLTGQIPSELGLMSNLEFFWAWSNPLTGTLPTELGLMTSMRRFGLWNCTLSGSIPAEMGMMESMDELAFDDNPKMVGTVPSELGMLSKLTTLHFGGTSLTGTVPTEITQLPLGSLFLHNSGLSGSLPSELGLLSGLWRLWLFNSSFTGTLATEFGSWQSLEYMRLQNNQFSGPIPSEIGRFENLTELLLHGNFFTGTVPKELGLLQKLTDLSVSNNSLTGSIDPALCELGSWLTEGATGIQVDCDLVDCSCDVCVCD